MFVVMRFNVLLLSILIFVKFRLVQSLVVLLFICIFDIVLVFYGVVYVFIGIFVQVLLNKEIMFFVFCVGVGVVIVGLDCVMFYSGLRYKKSRIIFFIVLYSFLCLFGKFS